MLDIELPEPIFAEISRRATLLGMTPGQLARALLHAAMLLQREPEPRVPPGTRRGRRRIQGLVFRDRVLFATGESRRHVSTTVSRALFVVLAQRAASQRISRARYVQLWLADLADGRLDDVAIQPVDTGQMYDGEDTYHGATGREGKLKLPRSLSLRKVPRGSAGQWRRLLSGPVGAWWPRKRSPSPPSVRTVARQLIQALYVWTTFHYELTDELARMLGVTLRTLHAARSAWMRADQIDVRGRPASGLVALDVDLPEQLAMQLAQVAEQSQAPRSAWLRGLLHAVILTNREPTRRPARVVSANPVRLSYEDPTTGRLVWLNKTPRRHLRTTLSPALDEALRQRAVAYGVTLTRYVVLWVTDWLEGRIQRVEVAPIEWLNERHDESYVRPVMPF